GSTILYLTYLGGPGFDDAFSIAHDDTNSAYVTGKTAGSLPINLALDTSPQPNIGNGGGTGAYVAKLSPSGNQLLYLTYLGAATGEEEGMIALDAARSAYVAIGTRANSLPSSFLAFTGGEDAYVVKLGSRSDSTSAAAVATPGAISGTVCANALPPCGGANPAINGATINVRNSDSGFQVATGATAADGTYTVSGLEPRNYKVSAESNGFGTIFFNNQTNFTSGNVVTVNS